MCAYPSPPAAGYLDGLYRFSPAANAWTALIPSGSGPSLRYRMGFVATPDGMLYVFGGEGNSGTERALCGGSFGCIGLAAMDAVMRRGRAAPPLLSLSLAEGTRVRREETYTHERVR
jgi:hypothetical protein